MIIFSVLTCDRRGGNIYFCQRFLVHLKSITFIAFIWIFLIIPLVTENTELLCCNFSALIQSNLQSVYFLFSDSLAVMLTPENGRISSALELISCDNNDRPKGKNRPKASTDIDKDDSGQEQSNIDLSQCSTSAISEVDESKSIKSPEDVGSAEPESPEAQVLKKRRNRPSTQEEREDALLPQLKPAPGLCDAIF